MDGRLIKRQLDVIRKDARRQTSHQLAHLKLVRRVDDIIIDDNVVAEKVGHLRHVFVQSSHHGGQMNHLSGFVAFKECFDLLCIAIENGMRNTRLKTWKKRSTEDRRPCWIKRPIPRWQPCQILDRVRFQVPI